MHNCSDEAPPLIEPGHFACGKCGGETTYVNDGGCTMGNSYYYCGSCDIAESWHAAIEAGVLSKHGRKYYDDPRIYLNV